MPRRRFKSQAGQLRLQRVLRAYAAHDPEVNYCQGMNFLAALLLVWMPSEAEAFGGLVVLMEERGLRDLYKKDMSALQVGPPGALEFVGRLVGAFPVLPVLRQLPQTKAGCVSWGEPFTFWLYIVGDASSKNDIAVCRHSAAVHWVLQWE